jgi:hypothetical protein
MRLNFLGTFWKSKRRKSLNFDGQAADADRLAELTQLARRIVPNQHSAPVLLSSRSGRIVMRLGQLVIKVHGPDADDHELGLRLQLLAETPFDEIFLNPLPNEYPDLAGPFTTLWPAGEPVDENLEQIPWQAAAELLARLHRSPLPAHPFPKSQGMKRVTDTLAKLHAQNWDQWHPDLRAVLAAAATLRFTDPQLLCLVHGDWHLGQMVSIPHNGKDSWRLIDIDDLGLGDPAWDLARPAAFFAAGLIAPGDWGLFLESYRAAGGPAAESFENPWQNLNMPARALVVQCAAAALIRSQQSHTPLSDAELHLVEACRRINFEEKKP